ncbi:ABC transporter ATP-binding protein [Kineosporia succinea]|uniref:ABC-type multidrug transport system ATPase subunit n=1 Tax=Kineosporia succinea TaxID=84632 RepID=A0ABT9P5E9_9ACTN|nr:ABC transporter ATP-binding protein [Kineosporia succinea]MDP9827415.1 ABC-type multidrug transport system ATPase subunit [Kineosporia succinea]
MPGTLLSLKDLEVGYGLPVCPPITLDLAPGDVVAVVGSNGSGKSTLLRTVVGLLQPLGGRMEMLGADLDERSRAFREAVASELGDEAFFPSLTVREHLLLTCYGHGVDDPDGVTDYQLDVFGLTERSDALPGALSSGQRRRLLLAATFARPRSLMILDEPEQRLDAAIRDDLAGWLVEERSEGGGVLMATHDPQLVTTAATQVVVISDTEVRVVEPERGAEIIRHEL